MSESSPFLPSLEETAGDDEKEFQPQCRQRSNLKLVAALLVLSGVAVASILLNIAQLWLWNSARSTTRSCPLPLTGLEMKTDVQFGRKTSYGEATNMDETDKLWYGIDTTMGVVALPNNLHLGSTFTFPWDKSKGVYVLNSYHSLHCLQAFYGMARNYQRNEEPKQTMEHIVHCLDVLRSDIMCTADDTPLSFNFQKPNMSEWPPKRKCRDWNQLNSFAIENSACFRRFSPSDPRYSTIEEFTFCPQGSPYE